jgi:hypothetical protein
MKWKRSKNSDLKAAYEALFGSQSGPAGQIVFLDLWDKCGMARTNFVPGEPDLSAFNDGCRSIFLHILQMAYEPEQIEEKVKETASMEIIDD